MTTASFATGIPATFLLELAENEVTFTLILHAPLNTYAAGNKGRSTENYRLFTLPVACLPEQAVLISKHCSLLD